MYDLNILIFCFLICNCWIVNFHFFIVYIFSCALLISSLTEGYKTITLLLFLSISIMSHLLIEPLSATDVTSSRNSTTLLICWDFKLTSNFFLIYSLLFLILWLRAIRIRLPFLEYLESRVGCITWEWIS